MSIDEMDVDHFGEEGVNYNPFKILLYPPLGQSNKAESFQPHKGLPSFLIYGTC